MGRGLVLNMADHGFAVGVYNRTASVTEEFTTSLAAGQEVRACYSLEELVESVTRPRLILLMVSAGTAVDALIDELGGLVESGDILMDGGNSHYEDTERRGRSLAAKGIRFFGVGISGGESGARNGPSMMPGGPKEAYGSVGRILEAIAARADERPCCKYLGPGGAGHYVKMVHNGIEYGFMQVISEAYALLKQILALPNDHLARLFAEWNEGRLESYLIEITASIFGRRDEKTGIHLIDLISGEAGQLGTGMWASQSAMSLHVPVPNIDVAVSTRNLSALDEGREEALDSVGSGHYGSHPAKQPELGTHRSQTKERLTVEDVHDALYSAMVITYAQGFAQLQAASRILGYDLPIQDVASIWQGGCIIRAALLRDIEVIFRKQPALSNLLLSLQMAERVMAGREALARVVCSGVSSGVPVPGLMAALAYLDGYRTKWLPSNLIQAQRDYFGAHTYRRIDADGVFHTDWTEK
jgi:6-phosphogluconate dehydrogenase